MIANPAVCVFAKPPRPGQVKTRLIPAVGAEGATLLATAFLADTLTTLHACDWARPVIATTGDKSTVFNGHPVWSQTSAPVSSVHVWLQGLGDLGARQERILRRGIQLDGSAIALGADSPCLTSHMLLCAREALSTCDAAIGPSHDGGYYLLALRTCPEGLLSGLPWSQPNTYTATCERLAALGLSFKELEPCGDVDSPADWVALCRQQARGDLDAPATTSAITTILQRD